ncbi:MAG TPA: hypothetical protein VMU84_15035 [Thermoanaerobaculia bacterium]|nr:hypothetical protein [Thermoanaerobaculia bacterium]
MIAMLLLAVVTIHPAAPTVGDLITVELEQPVRVQPSPSYEIVSQKGAHVVVRTFEPKPFTLRGPNVVVPVRSVLKPKDDLKPAPLLPPRLGTQPRLPLILIALAALLATLIWIAVVLLARKRAPVVVPLVAPDVRFRRAIAELRADPQRRQRWAALANELRAFLASTRSRLGTELTTSEVLARNDEEIVRTILQQGDLEKFSPWGARALDFDDVAARALALIPEEEQEVAA